MTNNKRHTLWGRMARLCAALMCAVAFTGCINEDLSKCGQTYTINYDLHLVINAQALNVQISGALNNVAEQQIANLLRDELKEIFTDHISDISLSFYTDGNLAHAEEHTINDTHSEISIFLPAQQYRHHAIANQVAESMLQRTGQDSQTAHIVMRQPGETIDSHSIGVFAGTLNMEIAEHDQQFSLQLYQINCATALVIDLNGNTPESVQCQASGFAESYCPDTDTYGFGADYNVNSRMLSDGEGRLCAYTVNLPSVSEPSARSDSSAWQIHAYVKLNGQTTLSTLTISDPVKAGQLAIIKAHLNSDGSLSTETTNVGVSVELDWKPGSDWDIDI